MSTIQKVLQDYQTSGHSIDELGKTVNKKRYYLAHNSKNGWYLKSFDSGLIGRIQLILRTLFGIYGDTHLGHVAKKLSHDIPPSHIQGNRDYCTLYRTLSAHWHRSTSFAWEIDTCVNCFAKERFKEPNGKRHPYCGRTCATEYSKKPRMIGTKEPEIIPGYTFQKLLTALTSYAKRGAIDFYEVRYNPVTSVFGNFHPCPVTVTLAGKAYTFTCSEAAFQAYKFSHKPHLIQNFTALDGNAAFKKARAHQAEIRSDWRKENVNAMKTVLKAKFEQNPKLKEILLATGSAILVEHTARDAFWGDAGNGTGENKLGVLLMELRKEMGGSSVDLKRIDYPRLVASFKV